MNKISRRQFSAMCMLGGSSILLNAAGCASTQYKPLIKELGEHDILNSSTVLYWTDVMLQAVRSQSLSPLDASRGFAMAHLAAYAAVSGNSFDLLKKQTVPAGIDSQTAYATAFSTALEEAWSVSFAVAKTRFFLAHKNKNKESVAWGKKIAKQVISLRTQDGAQIAKHSAYPKQYKKQTGAMIWSPTGPFYGAKNGPRFKVFARGISPAWGAQKTWLIDSVEQYEAVPFLEANSAEFTRQFEKVKTLGASNSKTRTAEQSEIALFWEDGLMGVTGVGHFQLVAMQLVAQQQYNIVEQARFFALLSLAQADAGIVAWHNKYATDIIRPETAIRFAHKRFGKETKLTPDSKWQSYIPTPSFPTYVSGHSMFGAASCSVMAALLGSDKINLTSPAADMLNWPNQLKGVKRNYTSLKQMSNENGMSREYGGVHWEIDNTEGLRLGDAVAKAVLAHVK